jgi:hypothetical protein
MIFASQNRFRSSHNPRKTNGGQISGAVLTFTNVTAFRASIDQAIYEREYQDDSNTVAYPLVVLGEDLHIQTANRAFFLMFRVAREAIQGDCPRPAE